MKIEHFALQVAEPLAVAPWYMAHLGFTLARQGPAPAHAHFLTDSAGDVMIEIYNNPKVTTPDYWSLDPLLVHIAFTTPDLEGTRDRLLQAGATLAEDITLTPVGDRVLMLRDPWGFAIQFVQRAEQML